jgi:hypothetical protein
MTAHKVWNPLRVRHFSEVSFAESLYLGIPVLMGKSELTMNVTKRQASNNMTESEFWNELQHLSSEVEHAIDFYYTYEEINHLGTNSEAAFSAFNIDPLFWNIQALSLQTSLFITVSRLFDKSPGALSIHRVLNAASAHPDFFSKQSLAARMTERKIGQEYIDNLVADAWEPNDGSDFRYLKKAASPHTKRISEIYQPIRNLHFGHKIIDSNKLLLELFAMTNRADLAKTLDFLHELVDAIGNLFLNGKKPEIGSRSFDHHNEKIRASARMVVRKAAGRELFPRRSHLKR